MFYIVNCVRQPQFDNCFNKAMIDWLIDDFRCEWVNVSSGTGQSSGQRAVKWQCVCVNDLTRSIWKMLGPFANASRRYIASHQVSLVARQL